MPQAGGSPPGPDFSTAGEVPPESIRARSFDGDLPIGPDFQVNESSVGSAPEVVAMDPTGDFVSAWDDDGNTFGDADGGIVGQRFRVTGDVGGRVWADQDRDGLRQPSEPGVAGITVNLFSEGSFTRETVTDAEGRFRFTKLAGDTLVGDRVWLDSDAATPPATPASWTPTATGSSVPGQRCRPPGPGLSGVGSRRARRFVVVWQSSASNQGDTRRPAATLSSWY